MTKNHFDVLIVGAGLAGVGAACHLQRLSPNKTFAILEGRAHSGGTWDLFRYPGVRSDSDMYTLGYSFRPWTGKKAIAEGGSILRYIRDTAKAYGIDKKILYNRRVEHAEWSSQNARWTVDVREGDLLQRFTCNFLFTCTGYYDYEQGHAPTFGGEERFKGQIVHPQFWPQGLEYAGKRVIVLGSGATAVTLVPAMAKTAAHVTMLQRSPTYVLEIPSEDRLEPLLRTVLPRSWGATLTRWKHVLLSLAFYQFCRRFPAQARKLLLAGVKSGTKKKTDMAHFSPRYRPWDQRVCFVPDGDMFDALASGRASMATDEIETFTETGVRLKSGATLDADIVVSATGLKLKFLGGIRMSMDGQPLDLTKSLAYKGVMFSDVPNLAAAIGYTNASWTLKADLSSDYVCRLLNFMDERGYTHCAPKRDPSVGEEPILDLASGYVQRAAGMFPPQGSLAPWKVKQNYIYDRKIMKFGDLEDGTMQFHRAPATQLEAQPATKRKAG